MKLPKFQERESTSMSGAFQTPAQMGQIKQRIAEVRPLTGVRDVQGELRVGLQKANLIQQIGKSVVDVSATFINAKQTADAANNLAAQKAASAERTNFAAALATELKIDANTLDAEGNRGFEVAEKKYREHMQAYDKSARDKYRFSGAKAESAWVVGKTTEDRVYTDNIKIWSNDAKIEQTKALNEVTLKTTRDPNTVKEIYAQGVKDGLYTQGDAQLGIIKWQSNIVQTNMVGATANLGRNSLYMNEDQFNAQADTISTAILNSPVPINPEVQRKLLGDLSALRIDYDERIMGKRQDTAYGNWMIGYMDAKQTGDPAVIVEVEDRMREPEAVESYGESNYIQMVKTASSGGTGGFTTPEARVTIAAMTEDVRDGDLQEIEMIQYLLDNPEQFTREDWDTAYRVAGTVQDPLIKSANAAAKYHSNMLFVKTEAPSMLSFEAQEQKADNIATAYEVSERVKARIDAWTRGEIPGPIPDVRKLVYEEGAKLYAIPDYMRNSSGSTPINIWDVDLVKSKEYIDEMFTLDTRKSQRVVDHQRNLGELNSVKAMLKTVPVKPEGM